MFRTHEEVEAFRRMVSNKLGTDFSPRYPNPHFLVSIQAFPGSVISDNELLLCLEECLGAIGIQMDKGSLRVERGGLVWVKMTKGDEAFSLGVTNDSMSPNPYIIVTVMPFGA